MLSQHVRLPLTTSIAPQLLPGHAAPHRFALSQISKCCKFDLPMLAVLSHLSSLHPLNFSPCFSCCHGYGRGCDPSGPGCCCCCYCCCDPFLCRGFGSCCGSCPGHGRRDRGCDCGCGR